LNHQGGLDDRVNGGRMPRYRSIATSCRLRQWRAVVVVFDRFGSYSSICIVSISGKVYGFGLHLVMPQRLGRFSQLAPLNVVVCYQQ
jgi:hypothetical protein